MKVKFFATIREHTRSREIDVKQGCGSVGIYCSIFALYSRGLCSFEDGKLGNQIMVLAAETWSTCGVDTP